MEGKISSSSHTQLIWLWTSCYQVIWLVKAQMIVWLVVDHQQEFRWSLSLIHTQEVTWLSMVVWVFPSEWLAGHFLAHVLELKNVVREGESRYLSADSFHLVRMSEIIKVTPSNREPRCKCSYPAGFTRWCQPERGEIRLTHGADRGREWKWVLITICDHSFSWCHDHRLYNRTQPYFDHFHFSYLEPGWSFQLMLASWSYAACSCVVHRMSAVSAIIHAQKLHVLYTV